MITVSCAYAIAALALSCSAAPATPATPPTAAAQPYTFGIQLAWDGKFPPTTQPIRPPFSPGLFNNLNRKWLMVEDSFLPNQGLLLVNMGTNPLNPDEEESKDFWFNWADFNGSAAIRYHKPDINEGYVFAYNINQANNDKYDFTEQGLFLTEKEIIKRRKAHTPPEITVPAISWHQDFNLGRDVLDHFSTVDQKKEYEWWVCDKPGNCKSTVDLYKKRVLACSIHYGTRLSDSWCYRVKLTMIKEGTT